MEGELVFIEELSKRLQTGGPPRGGIEIDRPRIEEFLSRYQPRHLTRSEQLKILHGFHDVLDREINRSEALENTFGDLIARIDQANTLHELKTLHCDLTVLAIRDFQETGSVRNLQQKCTRFRQEITCRLIKLVETEMVAEAYGPPPSAYAWISMGADGRREQTILTDQDSLLVYRDVPRSRRSFQGEAQKRLLRRDIREKPLDESQIDLVDSYFEIFSRKVINSLDGIGIKRCMGGVMPTSEKWRGSLEDWMDRLKQKIKYGSGTITVLDIIILMDARSIAGDASLGGRLIGGMRSLLERSPSILAEVAKSAVLMPVAIGFSQTFQD